MNSMVVGMKYQALVEATARRATQILFALVKYSGRAKVARDLKVKPNNFAGWRKYAWNLADDGRPGAKRVTELLMLFRRKYPVTLKRSEEAALVFAIASGLRKEVGDALEFLRPHLRFNPEAELARLELRLRGDGVMPAPDNPELLDAMNAEEIRDAE